MSEEKSQDPIIRINDLRAKVAEGIHLTKEEVAETVQLLRASRKAATQATTSRANREPSKIPTNLNDLFAPKPEKK